MIEKPLVDAVMAIMGERGRGHDGVDDAAFEALALEIAAAQGRLRRPSPLFCNPGGLDRIDPLPETAFKMMTVAQFPPSEAVAEFKTSGTSSESRGRLCVLDMEIYRMSALRGFELFCMYDNPPSRFMSLIPAASVRPDSSLSWMATFLVEEFDDGLGGFAAGTDGIDPDTVLSILSRSAADGASLFLLGTSLDFLSLFEFLVMNASPISLAQGSRLMHTGGPKASGRSITPRQLAADAGRLLAIDRRDVIEEFGMTELFSQAYDSPRISGVPGRLVPVPWMRTRILDPRTLKDVSQGERGLLVHYDLACCHTCVAIMAADTATKSGNGFCDLRRTAGAPARGCSHNAAPTPGRS